MKTIVKTSLLFLVTCVLNAGTVSVTTESKVNNEATSATRNIQSVFSGEGVMGDLYYLSPRYSQTISSTFFSDSGSRTNVNATTQITNSLQNIYSSIAKNTMGIDNLVVSISSEFQPNISSLSVGFQSLPSLENIHFSGLSAAQTQELYNSVASKYSSLQNTYTSFETLSDNIASGALIGEGLDGLANIEASINDILGSLESNGMISSAAEVLGDDKIESMSEAVDFSGNFSSNSQDASTMNSSSSDSNMNASSCTCCPSKPGDLIKKVDEEAKPLITKESELIDKASEQIKQLNQEMSTNKLGANKRDGYLGKLKIATAAELYMDQKKTMSHIKKIRQLEMQYKQAVLQTTKNSITDLEMQLVQ